MAPMTWNARLCRECRERFVPLRADQQTCSPCASQSDELHALLSYLRAHPEDPITRVSVATGVSEASISQLAQAGLLPVVPHGAEQKPTLHLRERVALSGLQGRGGEADRAGGRQLALALRREAARPGTRVGHGQQAPVALAEAPTETIGGA